MKTDRPSRDEVYFIVDYNEDKHIVPVPRDIADPQPYDPENAIQVSIDIDHIERRENLIEQEINNKTMKK